MSKPALKRGRRIAYYLAAILGILILLLAWLLPSAGGFLVNVDPPAKAQVAVVLAGDYWGLRVVRGGELARDGLVGKVLVSGASGFYGTQESELAVRYAVAQGFPEASFEALHMQYGSTQEEAHSIVLELKRRQIKSVLVVTSDYHTRRAGLIWRQTAPWLDIRMIGSPDRFFHRERWWRDRDSAKRVFDEWTKWTALTFDFFRPEQSGPVLP